jgi:hypothetical protein
MEGGCATERSIINKGGRELVPGAQVRGDRPIAQGEHKLGLSEAGTEETPIAPSPPPSLSRTNIRTILTEIPGLTISLDITHITFAKMGLQPSFKFCNMDHS